jgi:hypothetical protein
MHYKNTIVDSAKDLCVDIIQFLRHSLEPKPALPPFPPLAGLFFFAFFFQINILEISLPDP